MHSKKERTIAQANGFGKRNMELNQWQREREIEMKERKCTRTINLNKTSISGSKIIICFCFCLYRRPVYTSHKSTNMFSSHFRESVREHLWKQRTNSRKKKRIENIQQKSWPQVILCSLLLLTFGFYEW